MRARYAMCVGWPAFLAACVLELLVFAVVDPDELRWFGSGAAPSRQTVYTAAFLAFWLVSLGAGALTALLAQPAQRRDEPH